MPATKIGIIYATRSKMIRRVIVPDDDEQLVTLNWTRDGETLLTVPMSTNPETVVLQATGVRPPLPRTAVVDQAGKVVAMAAADPLIDTPPAQTTFVAAWHDENINVGCDYVAATREFVRPARTIPATVDNDGNPVPARIEPEKRMPALAVDDVVPPK